MIPPAIYNHSGERIAFSSVPGAPDNRDLVVLGHGLTSDRERPWSQGLATALQQVGVHSIRIAFSGNGESDGRFEDSNISKEVEDLGAVFDALSSWRISYVGHSMGGAVGVIRAAQDPRIHRLVCLAAMTHCDEFVERMFGDHQAGQPMLDKPHCPFSEALRADLLATGSTTRYAQRIRVPWLIVHGSEDDVVPLVHSQDLHAAAPESTELVVLDGVDHVFDGPGLKRMIAAVLAWW